MDRASESGNDRKIGVSGLGGIDLSAESDSDDDLDVIPWLKSPKTKKFMGKQDQLAVIAAGRALRDAGIEEGALLEGAGVYLCVGYIPFEQQDLEPLVRDSTAAGQFCMERFSAEVLEQGNPLLTFRCLPNMPIFHVSMNFGIQGSYFITYPGVGQYYLALERAVGDLRRGVVDLALVGAVADQDNFLVRQQLRRFSSSGAGSETDWSVVPDSAGCLCLELEDSARRRGGNPRLELVSFGIEYEAPDLLAGPSTYSEKITLNRRADAVGNRPYHGASSLPLSLCQLSGAGTAEEIVHEVSTFDGFAATSCWREYA
ncbi:MAG: hypothetical protein MK133_10570 [Planctomycetes bacterium]|nr:hypothetical protein [Planctomycetota bacterium]